MSPKMLDLLGYRKPTTALGIVNNISPDEDVDGIWEEAMQCFFAFGVSLIGASCVPVSVDNLFYHSLIGQYQTFGNYFNCK